MTVINWTIQQVVPETSEAITYTLLPLHNQAVAYRAGQFLTFLLQLHGREVRRSYSIASAPGIDKQVSITVKRKENGEISRYIHHYWKPGAIVSSLPPAGLFTLPATAAMPDTVVFMAAGSGIIPIVALLKQLLYQTAASRVILFYQNRTEAATIGYQALTALESSFPQRFTWIRLYSRPYYGQQVLRLSNGLLEEMLTTFQLPAYTLFYTCGRESFMRMVQFTLREMGYAEEQLRKEHFTIEKTPVPAFNLDDTPRTVTIHYQGKQQVLKVAYPTTILQAALNHNLQLPYSCRGGRCSACVARCTRGTVQMSINEVLTDKDLQQGLVLTCVGYAATDVELIAGG